MSRTIRRTRDKKRNKSGRSNFEHYYVTDCIDDRTINGWGGLKHYTLTGKEFDKKYWKFHGDTTPGYGWSVIKYTRQIFEDSCRMKNKEEIQRFYKDEDYEVFTHNPGCLSWER